MFPRSRTCILSLLLIALPARLALGETFDEVKKKLHDTVEAYKSLQYKSEVKTETQGEGYSMKSTLTSSAEYARKDGKILSHFEMKTVGSSKMGDQEMPLNSESTSVSDGTYLYTYTVDVNGKKAEKRKIDKDNMPDPFDPVTSLKAMEQMYTFKVLPDEKVEGKDCYAIEGNAKEEAMKAFTGRTVFCYDKKTGIMVKMTAYDAKGKVSTLATTKDVKINENIADSRFVFKAPPGVTVQEVPEAKSKVAGH